MMGRGMMSGGGICPMCGRMGAGMHGMMGGMGTLAVDAKGVYVLRGGVLTVFDHDLKQIQSKTLKPVMMKKEKTEK
jgi:hypothetical protein